MKLVLLVFLTAGTTASASPPIDLDELDSLHHDQGQCSEVRLDRKPDGPLANVPTRDQGALGSCTSHTGAILIDAYLARKFPPPSANGPPKHLTSPLAIYASAAARARYKGAFDEKSSWGPGIGTMLDTARTEGSCDLNDQVYDTKDFKSLLEDLQTLQELRKDPVNNPREGVDIFRDAVICHALSFLGLPQGAVESLKLAKFVDRSEHAKFWQELLSKKCVAPQTRIPAADLALPKYKWLSRQAGEGNKTVADLQREIDRNLEQRQQPVGIGYCPSFFDHSYPWFDPGAKTRACSGGMHASAVIGRQWRYGADGKRKCMYLVQNSWGHGWSSCLNYAIGRRLPSTRQGRDDTDCTGDGKIWVAEDELANVNSVGSLE